jgi:hypothetical protein
MYSPTREHCTRARDFPLILPPILDVLAQVARSYSILIQANANVLDCPAHLKDESSIPRLFSAGIGFVKGGHLTSRG